MQTGRVTPGTTNHSVKMALGNRGCRHHHLNLAIGITISKHGTNGPEPLLRCSGGDGTRVTGIEFLPQKAPKTQCGGGGGGGGERDTPKVAVSSTVPVSRNTESGWLMTQINNYAGVTRTPGCRGL